MFGMIPETTKVETEDDQLWADFRAYKEYESSDELKHFNTLEKEVKSDDFASRKKQILKEKYKGSEEHNREIQYRKMSRKFRKAEEKPDELTKLEEEINSENFQKRKEYLSMKPRERYETTEEYRKESEYKELKESDKITWYFKTRKKYPFAEIEKLDETFNESFSNGKLDNKKWITRYYWGDAILNEPYTMADDKSYPTDGKNIEFSDNKLHIITKEEAAEGKKWDPVHGFLNDTFGYTSGLISTGKYFRQKYGLFKAKIKMSSSNVSQAFWMVGDNIVPHIDVAKYEKGKLHSDYFWTSSDGKIPSKSITKTGGSRFTSDFYIFSLEWGPEKLVWKINDKVFKKQTSNVPQDEMYMVFSTLLKDRASGEGLPAAMEIDWIRVYKLKDQP